MFHGCSTTVWNSWAVVEVGGVLMRLHFVLSCIVVSFILLALQENMKLPGMFISSRKSTEDFDSFYVIRGNQNSQNGSAKTQILLFPTVS